MTAIMQETASAGALLRNAREIANISLNELAAQSEVSMDSLSRVERGTSDLSRVNYGHRIAALVTLGTTAATA